MRRGGSLTQCPRTPSGRQRLAVHLLALAQPTRRISILLTGLLVAGTLLVLCVRHNSFCNSARQQATTVQLSSTGRGAGGSSAQESSTAHDGAGPGEIGCPVDYPRHTLEEIRAGSVHPYILGGIADKPGCAACNRTDGWALPCQFKNGPLCPQYVQQSIISDWVARSFELPLTLTPCDLWPHLHGRTLFMMGDSIMLDFFKAATCFMFEFWPDLQHMPLTDDEKLQADLSTILSASCALLLNSTRICYIRVDTGQDMYSRALLLLPRVAARTDLLVLNFGLHHSKDYGKRLGEFAAYYEKHKKILPRLLWQQTLQQHFNTPAGEFYGDKPPFTCHQVNHFSVVGGGVILLEEGHEDPGQILQGGWRNAMADPIIRKAGIPILPSFNETLPMAAMHRDNGQGHECTHYCHPSALQYSVVALYRTLKDLAVDPPLAAATTAHS